MAISHLLTPQFQEAKTAIQERRRMLAKTMRALLAAERALDRAVELLGQSDEEAGLAETQVGGSNVPTDEVVARVTTGEAQTEPGLAPPAPETGRLHHRTPQRRRYVTTGEAQVNLKDANSPFRQAITLTGSEVAAEAQAGPTELAASAPEPEQQHQRILQQATVIPGGPLRQPTTEEKMRGKPFVADKD
jgi:hypothetical protein